MLPLLFWFLAAFGLCYVVGHARVSLPFRQRLGDVAEAKQWRAMLWFVELIECPACLGFWLGLAGGWFMPTLVPAPVPCAAFTLGLATCASGYILGRATGWLKEE